MAGRYAPGGDTFRIAVVALVLGVLSALVARYLLDTATTTAIVIGVVVGVLSTVLVGPLRDKRPARSNSSG